MCAKSQSFDSTPIEWMESYNAVGLGVEPLTGGRWAVGDAILARKVLLNKENFYEDQPDFFGSGQIVSRTTQISIGRRARDFFSRHLASIQISESISKLRSVELWPDAGNRLLTELFKKALIAESRPVEFSATRLSVVEDRLMYVGQQENPVVVRNALYERYFQLFHEQRAEFNARRHIVHEDILDLLFELAPEISTEQLAEIYLRFNLVVVGTIGFALGFALLETLSNQATEAEPRRVFRETLRLHPVAWLLSRKAICNHELGGNLIEKGESVFILPYAVHRHPRYWLDPLRFQPGRWADNHNCPQWIPFGAGEHTCAAVSLTITVLERIWVELFKQFEVSLGHVGQPSPIGPALASPYFELRLARR
jgi:hypothetical protein